MKRLALPLGLVLLAGCGTTGTPSTTQTPPTPTPPSLGPAPGPLVDGTTNSACGRERWAVKTLQDTDSGQIDARPNKTTLAALSTSAGNQAAPVGHAPPRTGVELFVWQLDLQLVEAKQEADSDIHLVGEQNGQTFVLEFPSPNCTGGAAPVAQAKMAGARANFTRACGQVGAGFTHLSGQATVQGVGFLDFDHGQTGRDKLSNGADLELHPVVSFDATNCAAG